MVRAGRRLIAVKGSSFTTQELIKEAGVALQTFYRYFARKDELFLAVIEDLVQESCLTYREEAIGIGDPVARLRFYITEVVGALQAQDGSAAGPRFITTEHWRLQQLYPEELAQATKPFTDLILPEIQAATDAGLLKPTNPEYDAWLITQLVMAVYHHYAFATNGESGEEIVERLWRFCLAALGGQADTGPVTRRSPKRRTAREPKSAAITA
jgi:AcrR family transcriptional regulator